MPARQRISKVRKLAKRSAADAAFIRKAFPELYQEAFASSISEADEKWESIQPRELSARRS